MIENWMKICKKDKIIVPEEFMPIVERIKEFDFDRVFGD